MDVAVVGAGPAGSETAHRLLESGLDVAVFEKKGEIGSPVQCSGLISRNLDRFVKPPGECIQHKVKGAVIHGPDKEQIRLRKPGTAAYVIDRKSFDQFMASRVQDIVRLGTGVSSVRVSPRGVSIKAGKEEVKARVLVGADGPGSVVRKHFKARPPETVQGVFATVSERDSSDFVELWLDKKFCDGFLWRIPRGDSVEYGMLGSSVKSDQLSRFFSLPRDSGFQAGLIPLGGCKSFFERTLLVGDAAAQTKPWSGGGVIYGLTAAGLAARTLVRALELGDLSEQGLSVYEDMWKNEFGQQISLGMMGRELYKDMSREQFREFFRDLSSRDLNRMDMDFPVFRF